MDVAIDVGNDAAKEEPCKEHRTNPADASDHVISR